MIQLSSIFLSGNVNFFLAVFVLFIYLQVFGQTLKSKDVFEKMRRNFQENKKKLGKDGGSLYYAVERHRAHGCYWSNCGMVDHDVRNLLQAITSDFYLLKEELKGIPQNINRQSVQERIGSIKENIYIDTNY